VDARRGYAQLGQPCHLVDHEGNQRRNYDRQITGDNAGHPVGNALSRPGWGDEKNVGTGLGRGNNLPLPRSEVGQAENFLEDGVCRIRRLRGCLYRGTRAGRLPARIRAFV
jgi:hypothetical protein